VTPDEESGDGHEKMKLFGLKSIHTRLLLWFLALSLLPVVATSIISSTFTQKALEQIQLENMTAIAKSRNLEFVRYATDKAA